MGWFTKDQGSQHGSKRDLRSDEQRIMVTIDASLEAVVRQDRVVVVTALIAVIALAWAYLLAATGSVT